MSTMTKQEIAAANRRRYDDLRAAGQGAAPKALPAATAVYGAPIAPDAVMDGETVPPGWYHTVRLRRGEALRIVDASGRSSVSVIGWCEKDMSERLNCADTAKIQWSAALSKGRARPSGNSSKRAGSMRSGACIRITRCTRSGTTSALGESAMQVCAPIIFW